MTPPHSTGRVKLAERALKSRALMRAPIWVYRAGLGFVFGHRMLLLEHKGRRTGAARFAVLEVLGHPAPDRYLVASGFGERAQWFQNVLAEPNVRISTGFRRAVPAEARRLTTSEADAALKAYVTRHPRAWAKLGPTLENTLGRPIELHDTALPMVEFHLG
ncbi:Uncharacterised protein [Mycolicibacterium vanbaalenii]|uniref:Nitroreductase n=1 Tax=Mycolicibacterium vanbaalenii TaxID=110539 RepID=A0A5S9Q200_MYCVN|nr:nitroreductase family deazaflavin-dependent oxidoreductase [Mycolicibacterium vanbaalenii]CAA0110901.1 Uncharacterised protein [Mycolicibacterium vanbaalenii]